MSPKLWFPDRYDGSYCTADLNWWRGRFANRISHPEYLLYEAMSHTKDLRTGDVESPHDRLLLSIIIPHRNRWPDLRRLLSTIPNRADIEVITVDDHSDEKFDLTFPSKVQGRSLTLPEHKRFAGTARNFGLESSRATYIFFADSDDTFEQPVLEKCLSHLATNDDDDCIYTRVTSRIEATNEPGSRHRRYNALVDAFCRSGDDNIFTNYFPPWGRFIRRSHLIEHQITFDEVEASNDVMFSLRLALSNPKNAVLDLTCYIVTQGNRSLTNAYTETVINARAATLILFNRTLVERGLGAYRVSAMGLLVNIFRSNRRLFFIQLVRFWRAGQPIFPRTRLYFVKTMSRFHRS